MKGAEDWEAILSHVYSLSKAGLCSVWYYLYCQLGKSICHRDPPHCPRPQHGEMSLQGTKAASVATHKLHTVITALWPLRSSSEPSGLEDLERK